MIEQSDGKIVFDAERFGRAISWGSSPLITDTVMSLLMIASTVLRQKKSYLVYATSTLYGLRAGKCGRTSLQLTSQTGH
jgi:hypothetical protein